MMVDLQSPVPPCLGVLISATGEGMPFYCSDEENEALFGLQ